MRPISYFIIIAISLVSFYADAAQISIKTAKQNAQRFLSQGNTLKSIRIAQDNLTLAYTAENIYNEQENCFYVFNRSNGGYVIVGADDCAHQVLATVDEGSFNYDEMPEVVKYWLKSYAEEISEAILNGEGPALVNSKPTSTGVNSARQDIPVMIQTTWNQLAPYNDMCPVVNGQRSVTGCVGTAMAQIMKFYNYPEKGISPYTATLKTNGENISIDFTQTTYDWANMPNALDESSTQEQKDAVATLLYHCGHAVDSYWKPEVTTAYPEKMVMAALIYRYGYDTSTRYTARYYYTNEQWEEILYNELATGRPIFYEGGDAINRHAFICDGYNAADNTFHFNWGWGGLCDGFYKVSAIVNVSSDYTYNQRAILGIQPPKDGKMTKRDIPLYVSDNIRLKSERGYFFVYQNYRNEDKYRAMTFLGNYCDGYNDTSVKVDLGLKLTNLNTNEVNYLLPLINYTAQAFSSPASGGEVSSILFIEKNMGMEFNVPYRLELQYKTEEGEWKPVIQKHGTNGIYTVTRHEAGVFTFEPEKEPGVLLIDNVSIGAPIAGERMDVSMDVSNPGELPYDGLLYVNLINRDTDAVKLKTSKHITVAGGTYQQPEVVSVNLMYVEEGNFRVEVCNKDNEAVSNSYDITVTSNIFTDVEEIKHSSLRVACDGDLVEVTNGEGINHIDIYNIQGQKIKSVNASGSTNETIEVGALPAGIYIVKVDGAVAQIAID